ncbi:hypothetical protein GCM10023156_08440 [Novipirellula rosea]|uniref:Uncharacterized protein n=1 Tax=Novipirellula rosea TaxID=1031540 RepID=A0ABP8MD90_9BACT
MFGSFRRSAMRPEETAHLSGGTRNALQKAETESKFWIDACPYLPDFNAVLRGHDKREAFGKSRSSDGTH